MKWPDALFRSVVVLAIAAVLAWMFYLMAQADADTRARHPASSEAGR